MIDWIAISLVLSGSILITIGDLLAKHWLNKKKFFIILCAILVYLFGSFLFALSLKRGKLAILGALFLGLNVLAMIPLSRLFFKEKLKTKQIIVILLIAIAIILFQI
jgi:multidrug transporter EmrE-like cation transporter